MATVARDGRDASSPTAPPRAGLERWRVDGTLPLATLSALRARVRDAAGVVALLDARRVLQAQTGGTPVLRANRLVCRALEDTGRFTGFALSTGRGM